jgi:hypothetical protein
VCGILAILFLDVWAGNTPLPDGWRVPALHLGCFFFGMTGWCWVERVWYLADKRTPESDIEIIGHLTESQCKVYFAHFGEQPPQPGDSKYITLDNGTAVLKSAFREVESQRVGDILPPERIATANQPGIRHLMNALEEDRTIEAGPHRGNKKPVITNKVKYEKYVAAL